MPKHSRPFSPAHTLRPGFTLVELLTVLGIIALVLAIIIPSLGKVRNTARKSATQSLMADLANACNAFQIDQRRLPGYFNQAQMGALGNGPMGQGFTNIENIVLDLAGGVVGSAVALVPGQVIQVGPGLTGADTVRVDVSLIGSATSTATGAASKGYLKPDAKFFQAQALPGQRAGMSSSALPVMVDSFGQPILAWVQNSTATDTSAFARIDSGTINSQARFFWNSNAGFLGAKKLGKAGEDQSTDSLLGSDGTSGAAPADRQFTMEALLGNPQFPSSTTPVVPNAARAPIVLHSSGVSGEYLSREGRGAKAAGGVRLTYANTAFSADARDPLTSGAFDDIIQSAGN